MATPKRILDKLKQNQINKNPILDLGGEALFELPSEISELTHLTMLDLRWNRLKSIKKLTNLTNLTALCLCINSLRNIKELTNLINLTTLDLRENELISVEGLERLIHLTKLDLSFNHLSNIKGLENLTNLKELNLKHNNLSSIKELANLTNLTTLYLNGNLLKEPLIEILKIDEHGKVDIDALFNYFKQLEEQGEDYLYEAKLLIIGKGGAGKTSLRTKMLDPTKPLPNSDESTHGIDIEAWKFPLENNKEFRVNIWDFGGQAIYHATHRYFLTSNALYVLVVDVRKDSEQSMIDLEIYWWLHAVELWGGTSPVLLLQNDTGGRLLDVDMGALRKEFEYLDNKTYQINLSKIQNNQDDSFNRILKAFKSKFEQLPNFEKKLPKIWVEIRQFIEEKQADNWMRLEEFMKICAEKKLNKREDAELLLSTFHELGICLWFQEHDYLRKVVILNPSWATNSAYAVLKNETVKNNKGYFSKEDLKQIWCEDCYVDMRGELLDLMKKFELCYELPQKDHFIAPQLLENKPPENYSFAPENALYVYYKYDKFMPKGILHRLMVVLHEKIANNRQSVWLTGALFEKDDAKSQVIEKYADREIQIHVIGSLNEKRDLMSIILDKIDEINQSFNQNHQLQVDKLIPCQCDKFKDDPEFFSYQTLKEFASDNDKIQCQKRGCRQMLDAQNLLDGISSKNRKTSSNRLLLSQQEKNLQKQQKLLIDKLSALQIARIHETQENKKIQLDQQLEETLEMFRQVEKQQNSLIPTLKHGS